MHTHSTYSSAFHHPLCLVFVWTMQGLLLPGSTTESKVFCGCFHFPLWIHLQPGLGAGLPTIYPLERVLLNIPMCSKHTFSSLFTNHILDTIAPQNISLPPVQAAASTCRTCSRSMQHSDSQSLSMYHVGNFNTPFPAIWHWSVAMQLSNTGN